MLQEIIPHENIKTLYERALVAGRQLQSPQTAYVHYYHGKNPQQLHHTIPVIENALFILALFRSRSIENIQEAKILLTKLLVFQSNGPEQAGNFPTYLHEYPTCNDPTLALQIVAPFYWILTQFGHVLGTPLKESLENASSLALKYSLEIHQNKPFRYALAVQLISAYYAYGKIYRQEAWIEEAKTALEGLAQAQLEGWSSTAHLTNILIGLQMVYPSLSDSEWAPLWEIIQNTWHSDLSCYVGPCMNEWQQGEEPQPTAYDLYAGYFAGKISQRTTISQPYHLYAALIQPTTDRFLNIIPRTVEGKVKKQNWRTCLSPHFALTMLEKTASFSSVCPNYTYFRLVWGNEQHVHSIVCQGGEFDQVEYSCHEKEFSLLFHLAPVSSSTNHRDKKREITFFIDKHKDLEFLVEGKKSNTFSLLQPLTLTSQGLKSAFTFRLVEGKGDFFGHFMRGSRPSQYNYHEEHRFAAYDWMLFLRGIRRSYPCGIQVVITIL